MRAVYLRAFDEQCPQAESFVSFKCLSEKRDDLLSNIAYEYRMKAAASIINRCCCSGNDEKNRQLLLQKRGAFLIAFPPKWSQPAHI